MQQKHLLAASLFAASTTAHFHLLEPYWRGSSLEAPASQWIYPCANVNETTDIANRTVWPPTSGSTLINGSHPSALTAINLALGANATNFNISLVPLFNQTGAGTFCLSETGRANLDQGFKDAGYTGADDERINGLMASVQVIQLGHSGSALYNCADIIFNSTAKLLSDDQCKNGTGVSGVAIQNVGSAATAQANGSATGDAAKPTQTNGAGRVGAGAGAGGVGTMVLGVALAAVLLY
ncbi:hypothetical protein ACJQWK_01872 [Exserohilum turcicum]|uniref:Copper acquisition factor BIM1-like domain-containing protein n=1 Tax=Exserohilum turcicum (strain 28A) TaxID=671987 RepID=R0KFI5_EXST2|nr:uncharacterized protein SETTUDRAFT_149486 [Exserohilum turcica Et28A]EOA88074.1 hypothetical protein SETTUDRAFT_149486 [Exserohilum turcica Et28A]